MSKSNVIIAGYKIVPGTATKRSHALGLAIDALIEQGATKIGVDVQHSKIMFTVVEASKKATEAVKNMVNSQADTWVEVTPEPPHKRFQLPGRPPKNRWWTRKILPYINVPDLDGLPITEPSHGSVVFTDDYGKVLGLSTPFYIRPQNGLLYDILTSHPKCSLREAPPTATIALATYMGEIHAVRFIR